MKSVLLASLLLCATGSAAEDLFGGLKKLKKAVDTVKEKVDAEDVKKAVKTAKAIRKGAADITEEEEHYIGRAVAARLLASMPPVEDEALNRYVQSVLQSVAGVSDRPELFSGWHAQVVESDEVNAVSAPGGYVFLTTGLLATLEDEEELAAVLAHEAAHIAERHGVKTIKASRLSKAFALLGQEAAHRSSNKDISQLTDLFGGSVDDIVKSLVVSGYSQDKEFEADRLGAAYARAAMYDPQALNRFIERSGSGKGGFLKTHPSAKKRLKALDEEPLEPAPGYAGAGTRKKRFAAAVAGLGGRTR